MRKKIYILLTLLAGVLYAHADGFYADPVSIQQGKQAKVAINYQFDNDDVYVGYEFILQMPDGISTLKDENGLPVYELDSQNSTYMIIRTTTDGFGALPQTTNNPLVGNSGTLMTLTFVADPSLPVGTERTVTIKHVKLTKQDEQGALHTVTYDESTFTVTIVERLTTLDELSTDDIEAEEATNVQLLRTLNDNEWSTICLPFAMTGEQVAATFGSNVQIGDLDDYETEESGRDVTAIVVKFNAVTITDGIEANHPYIIKVSEGNGKSSYRIDNVDITPGDPVKKISRKDKFVGTYKAETIVPEFCLFLNGNKFWYSTGKTKMKAFRAYFDFNDVLSEVENASNSISLTFEQTNGIDQLTQAPSMEGVYDLQGRKIQVDERKPESLKKGVYIINGKKVTK